MTHMSTKELATTTIAYKYLPGLVAKLVATHESFSMAPAEPGADDVAVYVDTKQCWLDEWSDEAHGGFVIRLDCEDVWRVAAKDHHDIEDGRYDAAEAVLSDVQRNLEDTWAALDTAIEVALTDYCKE